MFEECLYFNSNALARTVTRIWTEAYSSFDLSPPHAFMLRVVLAKPGLMPRELATELSLSRSTITRFLDSLEKRGFVVRKMVAQDGREVQIFPTESAQAIHEGLDQTGKNLSKQMQTLIGKQEVLETIASLRKFQKNLEG